MNKLKRILALTLLVTLPIATPVVAMAHNTDESSGDDSSSNSVSQNTKTEVEVHASNSAQKIRQTAEDKTTKAKDNATQKTKEARQKVCENRKGSINNRISRTEKLALQHKERLDSIYAKVKAFQTSKNLVVDNYDQLTVAVDSAQADAVSKITALQAVDTTVDCSSQAVAEGLSSYRTALSATRDSLKTYKTTLVDLIKAVKASAQAEKQ